MNQSKRYNPTERLGVNVTENIFIKDFEWIFREQAVVDVGIDALIEESINGNPTGKFIALQIKSGKGNFSISREKITYYISNIHYNYWLNFDIPVLLIAHLPESNKTLWIEISKSNIKKTKKRWKIEIPLRNVLNLKSKLIIQKLLTNTGQEYQSIKIFKGQNIDDHTIYDILEKIKCIEDATQSTLKTIEHLNFLDKKSKESNKHLLNFNKRGLSSTSPQVVAYVGSYAKNINLTSKRMENECEIFSETFGQGLFAYEQALMINYEITKDISAVRDSIVNIQNVPSSIKQAILGMEFLRDSLEQLPNDYKTLNEAKKQMLQIITIIIEEYKIAQKIVSDLISSFTVLTQSNSD
ncbi:DUF4365 domain-containing protein [Maribacter sp. R86514]|uniref:DUF4365 domain-containing protein n=1 Tax=Maribacter sp. R86514 TaxID=3093854 RepID=UPI0037C7CCB0